MKNVLVACFTLLISFVCAQQGDFLITHHFPRHSNIDNSNFEITNDSRGTLCIANRSGVLKYDGNAWDFYPTPSAALSLAVDSSDVVYVGCIGSVGMISYHDRSVGYQPLIETDTLNDLFLETHFLGENIYFLGNNHLLIYHIPSKEIKQLQGNFLNLYELDAEMFVNTTSGETYQILDSLIKVKTPQKIAFTSKRFSNPDLVVSLDNQLYEYENYEFKKLTQNKHIQKMGYEIQEIHWVNDSLFVCSTFENGLILFNRKDPDYFKVTNYQNGLPDNEIYTIHADDANGIWVSHEFGISHIAPLFPAVSFSHFEGLSGNLTSVSRHNERLWVTTSLGLFYFDSDTLFENKVYYEVKQGTTKKATTKKTTARASSAESQKPFVKRLFGKKERAQATTNTKKKSFLGSVTNFIDGVSNVQNVKGKLEKNTQYVRKVKKIPIDIDFSYKQIQGASGKFLSLLPYKDKLLAISTSGVYEINNEEAELIISENIRSYLISDKGQLIICNAALETKIYNLIEDVWLEQASTYVNDIIVSMRETETGEVWMAGTSAIYKTFFTDTSLVITDKLKLNNIFLDQVDIIERNDTLFFINSQGYFYFDPPTNSVKADGKLGRKIGMPKHHLLDQTDGSVWVFNGKIWYRLKKDGGIVPYDYLGLFSDLRFISLDSQSEKLWLITENNELLKYDPAKKTVSEGFQFFLKKVSNEKGVIDPSEKFILSYDENFLTIEFSKPDFLGLLNPEFQYKLECLHQDWSEWTRSKSIDFSYLPEGDYKLFVRARDAFGRIEEGEVLAFSVKPPYWQAPWFYAIEISFFGMLVFLSTKLNQDNSKNRLIRGGLTLLTLVLIIEFLQSAIGSLFDFQSTPVVDFLLDASIAFMIFPLEKLLRELMTQGKVKVNVSLSKEKIGLLGKDSHTK